MAATAVVDHAAAAATLHAARQQRRSVAMLTERWPELTSEDAYRIQELGLQLREGDGERIVGGKLGFTSAAMRAAMRVDAPNTGWVTDAMLRHDGVVDLDDHLHPKVEPEIAFVLAQDLRAPVTSGDVLRATAAVVPCLEVVDSRYHDFRFTALDNVADDSSAGAFVLGDPVPVDGIDLRTCGVVLETDGEVVATAAGAAVLDHPAAAVAWMVDHTHGRRLEAGHVVLSGGLTAPVDLSPGTTVRVTIDRLGSAELRVRAPRRND
jgi:2-keto-4-pentenoate hydratase